VFSLRKLAELARMDLGEEDDSAHSNMDEDTARVHSEYVGRGYREKSTNSALVKQDAQQFINDFNPGTSERERRKRELKSNMCSTAGEAATVKGRNASLYDGRGFLAAGGDKHDLCDCMSPDCAGCHFPCAKCMSQKCGSECRVYRKWQYETVELDGVPGSNRRNPMLLNVDVARDVPLRE